MEVSGLEDEYRLSAGKPRLIYTKTAVRREPRLARLLARAALSSASHISQAGGQVIATPA
jgi:hypothetical protein